MLDIAAFDSGEEVHAIVFPGVYSVMAWRTEELAES